MEIQQANPLVSIKIQSGKNEERVESVVPLTGNTSAKLQQGDIVIELTMPHLSFEMSVTFINQ